MITILEDRKIAHIGMATIEFEKDRDWYMNSLGFREIGIFRSPSDQPVSFLDNGTIIFELFRPDIVIKDAAIGKIDHIAFQSANIEEDYKLALQQSLTIQIL